MSAEAVTWAKRTPVQGMSQKLLLLLLADYCDEEWSCYPGQARLAQEACMGERTVRRVLAELETAGLIKREERRRADGYRTSDRFWLGPAADSPAKSAGDPSGDLEPGLTGQSGRSHRPSTTVSPATVAGQELPEEPPVEPPDLSRGPAAQQALIDLPAQPIPARPGRAADLTWEVFWATYPRRVAKAAARKAWDRALRRVSGDASVIVLGAARYRDDPNREPQYTAHPATWLNADRWEDEALPERTDGMNRTERALRRVANQPTSEEWYQTGFGGPRPLSIAAQVFALADRPET